MRLRVVLLVVTAAALAAGTACKKKGRNLAFGAACDTDNDCASGICLFLNQAASKGWCTKECDLDRNDCPEGKACLTLASHAGRSGVPVCGEAPPIPLGGPGGPPRPPMPPGATTSPPPQRPPGAAPQP
ncbi:MAG: hypothetical protein HY907_00540 [Deltaproteobacteria bacterium]|nr:hypothetical protein [Deltaproteobacteria bacterium]